MSSENTLNVVERKDLGSGSTKKLRREGFIPVNYYFQGGENTNLAIDQKSFMHVLHSGSHIFEMTLGKKKHHVQIKELQYHPVNDSIMHIDLLGFKMTDKINITVPLVIEGEAPGVKEGGVLMQTLNHIDIYCLPTNVPENIAVDISELEIGHHISIGDLEIPENVDVQSDTELSVVTIQIARGPAEDELVEGLEEDMDEEAEEGETSEE